MTVKKSKSTKKQVIPKDSPGFTASETKLIDQLEVKKKMKHAEKEAVEESKVGNMFKKKKEQNKTDETEESPTKILKAKGKKEKKPPKEDDMEVDENSKVENKKSKKTSDKIGTAESLTEVTIPGFSAPKVAPKRKHESEEVNGKKAKKVATGANNDVSKKTLKIERKTKENPNRYLLSVKAKKLWEDLRREDATKEKQLALSAELFGLIKGHTQEVSLTVVMANYCNF